MRDRPSSWLALFWLLFIAAGPAQAETARIVLRNGDVVTGELIERSDSGIVLEHAVLGRMTIPSDQIAPSTTHPGIAGTSILEGWDKEISLGLIGSQGDTDEVDLRIAASLSSTTEKRRDKIAAVYEVGYSDGKLDDHDANVTGLHDWLWRDSRWFAFAYGLYDYDHFEAWKHRLTFGSGPGYRLIPWDTFTLDTRFGPFFTYEFGDERNARPEFAVGLFANWTFRQWHTLSLSNVYFQTLDENEQRNVSRLEWKLRFAELTHISLKLGATNEYDSASKKSLNNLKYFSAINFDF